MRIRTTITVALAASALLLAACGGSEKQASEPAPLPGDETAESEAAPAETTPADPAEPAENDDAPPPAAAGDAEVTDADLDAAFQMLQAMATAAKNNVGDCDAAATELQGVLDQNEALVAKLQAAGDDPEVQQRFDAKYGEQLQPVMMGMMSDLQACQDHEGIQKVFESMN